MALKRITINNRIFVVPGSYISWEDVFDLIDKIPDDGEVVKWSLKGSKIGSLLKGEKVRVFKDIHLEVSNQ